MTKSEINEKLIEIKVQINSLAIKYIECEMPASLSDVSKILIPFTNIDASLDYAIKRLSSDVIPGSIPKQNTLNP